MKSSPEMRRRAWIPGLAASALLLVSWQAGLSAQPLPPPPPSEFVDSANTGNQGAIAKVFDDQVALGPQDDTAVVINELNTISDDDLRGAFDQIAFEEHGNSSTVGTASTQTISRAEARTRAAISAGAGAAIAFADSSSADSMLAYPPPPEGDTGEAVGSASGLGAAPPEPMKWKLWMSGFGGKGDTDGNGEAEGFAQSSLGMSFGVDYRLTQDAVIGFLFGFSFTDLFGEGQSGNTQIDTVTAGLYGGHSFGAAYVQALAAYTHHDFDTERDVLFAGINRDIRGNHQGDEFDTTGEAGYVLTFGESYMVPFVGVAYANLSEGSFSESGGEALDLDVNAITTESLRTALGLRFATSCMLGEVRLLPEFSARWEHEMYDDSRDSEARFFNLAGQPRVTLKGVDVQEDSAVVGFGLSLAMSESVLFYVNYEGRFGDIEINNIGRGGVQVRW